MSLISVCCGATPYLGSTDYGRCSDCKENCEFEIDQELDDCDAHTSFDDFKHKNN